MALGLAIRPVYWQRHLGKISKYVYELLCLRCEDAILAILCTGLPISTTAAAKLLNSLIFQDDTKCITGNGEMIIKLCAD